jgi:hypothetical protein
VVTLSAVFPPLPPTEPNQAQFQNLAQRRWSHFRHRLRPHRVTPMRQRPRRRQRLRNRIQLAQLNRALEQLGISPQSISLDNRLALIRSANDPRRF